MKILAVTLTKKEKKILEKRVKTKTCESLGHMCELDCFIGPLTGRQTCLQYSRYLLGINRG